MALVLAVMHRETEREKERQRESFCPCLFILFFFSEYSDIDKSTERSTIPVCPSLMCFLNRHSTEGTNSSKILCFMIYVCFLLHKCFSWLIFITFRDIVV